MNRTETYSSMREILENNCVPWIYHPVLATLGISANTIVGTVIAGNRSMHTTPNCYVFSIILSDLVVLSDVVFRVFGRLFELPLHLNGTYVDCVTLEASVLTLVIFALERYDSLYPRRTVSLGCSNGLKSVLILWSTAATLPAIELNLNSHFLRDTQAHIFLMSTTMFLVLPTFVIITLATFILVDTRDLKNNLDRDDSRVFLALTLVFYVSMAPYRIVSLVRFMAPTFYRSQTILKASYLIVELSAVVNPILYGFVSDHFRTAFKETLRSFCARNQRTDDQILGY